MIIMTFSKHHFRKDIDDQSYYRFHMPQKRIFGVKNIVNINYFCLQGHQLRFNFQHHHRSRRSLSRLFSHSFSCFFSRSFSYFLSCRLSYHFNCQLSSRLNRRISRLSRCINHRGQGTSSSTYRARFHRGHRSQSTTMNTDYQS